MISVTNDFLLDQTCLDLLGIIHDKKVPQTVLSTAFHGSYGFSYSFIREDMDRLYGLSASLFSLVDAIASQHHNAFFLNILCLMSGGRVERHVDTTLSKYLLDVVTPSLVSVVYLNIPSDLAGGELHIYAGETHSCILPRNGMLVTFSGEYHHEVLPFYATDYRISIVLEQYQLSCEQLQRIPRFRDEEAHYAVDTTLADKLSSFLGTLSTEEKTLLYNDPMLGLAELADP